MPAGVPLHGGHLDVLQWEAESGSRYALSLLRRLGWVDRGPVPGSATKRSWHNEETGETRQQISMPRVW